LVAYIVVLAMHGHTNIKFLITYSYFSKQILGERVTIMGELEAGMQNTSHVIFCTLLLHNLHLGGVR
jgi:hypothetical protein